MRGGALRHPIVIQTQTEAKDSYGAVTPSWATFASVRAEVSPVVGREYFVAKQSSSSTTHRFRIRYLANVTAQMRILFDSRYFIIESVIDIDERNKEMVLMATEAEA